MNVRPTRDSASDIAHCIGRLQIKIEDIAQEAGVDASHCIDLECTLEAMPYVVRRRVTVLLQAIQLQAELNENPAMVTAAGYALALAQEVWTTSQNRSVEPRAVTMQTQARQ